MKRPRLVLAAVAPASILHLHDDFGWNPDAGKESGVDIVGEGIESTCEISNSSVVVKSNWTSTTSPLRFPGINTYI